MGPKDPLPYWQQATTCTCDTAWSWKHTLLLPQVDWLVLQIVNIDILKLDNINLVRLTPVTFILSNIIIECICIIVYADLCNVTQNHLKCWWCSVSVKTIFCFDGLICFASWCCVVGVPLLLSKVYEDGQVWIWTLILMVSVGSNNKIEIYIPEVSGLTSSPIHYRFFAINDLCHTSRTDRLWL